MEIKITSVCSEDVSKLLRSVTVNLEDRFNLVFRHKEFGSGVDQFTVIIVAVDSDPSENKMFSKPHNKVGKFKHMIEGDWKNFISIALEFDPEIILSLEVDEFQKQVLLALLERLDNIAIKIPKQFSFIKFSEFFKIQIRKLLA